MRIYLLTLTATLAAVLCSCGAEKVKEGLNKGGEIVGEAAGEFTAGVASGVEQAFNIKMNLSDELQKKGVSLGKIVLNNDTTGVDNRLSIYVIYQSDFQGPVTVKVYDNQGLEMGRSRVELTGKKDEARFVDFNFDKRTNIDRDSKVVME